MSRWRSFIALVVLALWMPATSHCALESAGLLKFAGCCDHDAQDVHHDAGMHPHDCASIDRTVPSANHDGLATSPIFFLAYELAAPVTAAALPRVAVLHRTSDDPPEDWLTSWDFEHRTALPARAPSTSV